MDWEALPSRIVFDAPDRLTDVTSWHTHVPFAFWCVEVLRPRLFVELGTHKGDSYSAFCQAVKRLALPTACYAVDTWKGDHEAGFYSDEVLEELRAYHDPRYAAFSRLVRATFDEALAHFADGSIDLLHIDGLHTYEAVSHDFETWLLKLSRRAVVLFHDVNVREPDFGTWRFWEEVRVQYPHFTFLHGHGLGVLLVGREVPEPLRRLAACPPESVAGPRTFFAGLGHQVELTARVQQVTARLEAADQDRARQGLEEKRLVGEVARLEEALAELREATARQLEVQRAKLARQAGEQLAEVGRAAAEAAAQAAREAERASVASLEAALAELREATARQLEVQRA